MEESGLIRVYAADNKAETQDQFVAAIRFDKEGEPNKLGKRLANYLDVGHITASSLASCIMVRTAVNLNAPQPLLVPETTHARYVYEIVVERKGTKISVFTRNCTKGKWDQVADFLFEGTKKRVYPVDEQRINVYCILSAAICSLALLPNDKNLRTASCISLS